MLGGTHVSFHSVCDVLGFAVRPKQADGSVNMPAVFRVGRLADVVELSRREPVRAA